MAEVIQWGDVPTWISAVVAVLALIGLAVGSVVAYKIYKVESGRDQLASQDRRRSDEERAARAAETRRVQADKVAAWYGANPQGVPQAGALIRNASDLPIFDVTVRYYLVDQAEPGVRWEPNPVSFPEQIIVVPPQDTVFSPISAVAQILSSVNSPERLVIGLEFRDAAGTWWNRGPSGELTELEMPNAGDRS